MRGRLAYRGPDPDDVRGVRGHGREGGARPQVRRKASLDPLHPTGGHFRTRAVNPGEGRTRGGGAERRASIPLGNRLHRRSASSRRRPGTDDRAKEDEGLARERIAHERAGVVDPPRLARNDLPHPSPVIASRQVQRAELHFRNSLPPGPRKRAPREPRRVPGHWPGVRDARDIRENRNDHTKIHERESHEYLSHRAPQPWIQSSEHTMPASAATINVAPAR